MRLSVKLAVLLAALPLAAAAQDPLKVDSAHYRVLLDNASVRVLKISYPVGEKSNMHSHPDAMLVPLASSKARFTMADGKTQDMEVTKEVASYTPASTHLPANVGTTPIDAVLVEFKAKTPALHLYEARPRRSRASLWECGGKRIRDVGKSKSELNCYARISRIGAPKSISSRFCPGTSSFLASSPS